MALPETYRMAIQSTESRVHSDHAVRTDLIIGIMGAIAHLSSVEKVERCGLPLERVPGEQPFGMPCPLTTEQLQALYSRLAKGRNGGDQKFL